MTGPARLDATGPLSRLESWVGGSAPEGLRGDDIGAALDAAFFGQLGGVDAAVTALRARAGVILDPAVVAAFTEDPRRILAEAQSGDPRNRMLDVEPQPVVERSDASCARWRRRSATWST